MKIVVIGGNGRIGSKVVKKLVQEGHDVVAASPSTGFDATTGRGVAEALAGAAVVVDVSNSPSFELEPAMAFFESCGRTLAREERKAGTSHHVALSVVGTERLQESGYFRAKLTQERLIAESGIPYTIVRATQFFEFLSAIAAESTIDDCVRLATVSFQPIAAEDVATAVVSAALAAPLNGMVEVAGPERRPMSELIGRYLRTIADPREVVADPQARYFGIRVDDRSLVPGGDPRLGTIRLDDWMQQSTAD